MKVVCDVCGTYIEKKGLQRHKLAVHEKKKDFVCNICGMGFPVKYKLHYHQVKHSDVRNFNCAVCGKAFKTRSDMLQHEKKHTSGTYRCPECIAYFESRTHLDFHLRELHSKGAREYGVLDSLDCPICSKTFTRKEHVRRHLKCIHEVKKEAFDQVTHDVNVAQDVNLDPRTFTCLRCNVQCIGLENLKTHFAQHHEKEGSTVSCDICNKTFSRNDHLKRHIVTVHQENRMFPCELCESAFNSIPELKTHIKEEHDKNEKLCCNLCPKIFTSSAGLREHLRTVHDNKRIYICQYSKCKAAFSKPSRLRYHQEAMHVKRTYFCDYCGFKSSSKTRLKFHIINDHIRTDRKDYTCEICSKTFGTRSHWKRHKLKVHKSKKFDRSKEKTEESTDVKVEIKQENNEEVYNESRHEVFVSQIKQEVDSDDAENDTDFLRYNDDYDSDNDKDNDASVSGIGMDNIEIKTEQIVIEPSFHVIAERIEDLYEVASDSDESKKGNYVMPQTKYYKCDHCPRIYATHRGMKQHSLKHYPAGAADNIEDLPEGAEDSEEPTPSKFECYKCDYCPRKYATQRGVQQHCQKSHSKRIVDLLEIAENSDHTTSRERRGGRKTDTPKNYKCDYCHRAYTTWRGKKQHCRKDHSVVLPNRVNAPERKIIKLTGPPICDYCGQTLKSKATLIIHFRRHLKNLQPEFCCQFCGKVFNHFSSFQLHRRNHTKDFNKPCPHCPRKFLTNQTLKWHVDYHHLNKPAIPKEICSVCGKSVQKFYMKIHMQTHTGTFKCETCGRACITQESLKFHRMQHTKMRPFDCFYCDKAYTFEKNLKFHIRKFHADVPGIEEFIASMSQKNNLTTT